MRRALLIAVLTLSAGLASGTDGVGAPAHDHAGDRAVRSDIHRSGRWLVDRQGRVVVLHGFNVVRKTAPYYPAHFSARDARYLIHHGFNTVRIGLIWAGVEPRPGRYDDTYIRKVVAFNDLLARHGIHALIDFHQDAWSKSAGGDGAPEWATLSNNLLSDFQSFWDNAAAADGVGIQTHFANAWKHVVGLVDASPGARRIVGYDPFNEPYAGLSSLCAPFVPCPAFEAGELTDFYRRMIAAIRSTGDRHVIFPEGIAQNGIAEPSVAKFDDPQTAFTFHYYCPVTQMATSTSPVGVVCRPVEQHGIGSFLSYDRKIGVPGLLGEFSCNDDDVDNAAMVDLAGRNFLSWTSWMYYRAKSDPANCGGQGFLRNDDKPAGPHNVKPGKLAAFGVPYAQAVAGTPVSSTYDRAARRFVLVYRTDAVPGATLQRGARTRIFVPRQVYPHGYRVSADGARHLSKPSGEQLVVATGPGVRTVRVTIRPA